MKKYIFKNFRLIILKIPIFINKKGFFHFAYYLPKLVIPVFKKNIREQGINYCIQSIIQLLFNFDYISIWINDYNKFWTWFYTKFKSSRTFNFQGNEYKYFYHKYSITWSNERSVEIPIIWKIVKEYESKKILEIGNVLSHFFCINHDIVDKYEKGNRVINRDVTDFRPIKKYELIISISTLEHVGWDEIPREPLKILKAIENLKNLLNRSGKIVITLPIGHSPVLNKLIIKNKLKFSKCFYLRRKSRSNKWREVNLSKVSNVKYGSFTRYSATGLVIGFIEKSGNLV